MTRGPRSRWYRRWAMDYYGSNSSCKESAQLVLAAVLAVTEYRGSPYTSRETTGRLNRVHNERCPIRCRQDARGFKTE